MARCTAHVKSTGLQCNAWAIHGGTVCYVHGGAAPQVKRKAAERFAVARDLALATFVSQLEKKVVSPPTSYAAARDFAKTVAEMQAQEAAVGNASVVDDWLEEKRAGR